MVWMGIITLLILFTFLLIIIKINIWLSFFYESGEPRLIAKLMLFNKRIYEKEFFLIEKEETFEDEQLQKKITDLPKKLSNMFQSLTETNYLITIFLQNICLHKFSWVTHVGLGEASATGLMIGPIWTVKGLIAGVILQKVKCFPNPEISLIPHFLQEKLQTELICIGSIRIGKAIYALIKMRKVIKKVN